MRSPAISGAGTSTSDNKRNTRNNTQWASSPRKSYFRWSIDLWIAYGFAGLFLIAVHAPSPALANCQQDTPVGGTTTCSGTPSTFPNGGASPAGGNTTLDVNNLAGNVAPNGGTASANISVGGGKASNGTSLPVRTLNQPSPRNPTEHSRASRCSNTSAPSGTPAHGGLLERQVPTVRAARTSALADCPSGLARL